MQANEHKTETTALQSPVVESVRIVVVNDESADASYLEQDGFEERLAAYRRNDFGYCGVMLEATVKIPHGDGWILQTITTPGLWSVEDDSTEQYVREIAADEGETLAEMLEALSIPLLADTGEQWEIVTR